jgi:hypothetical protein
VRPVPARLRWLQRSARVVHEAGAVILIWAGLAKLRRPEDTARALQRALPELGPLTGRRGVQGASAAEVALGAGVLAGTVLGPRSARAGSALAALSAVSWAGLAAGAARVRARGGALASCGCFGRPDTPATAGHVLLNLGFAAAAVAVPAGGTSGPGWGRARASRRPGPTVGDAVSVALVALAAGGLYEGFGRAASSSRRSSKARQPGSRSAGPW